MERLYCDGCGRELAPANAYPGDENGGPYCTACELRRQVKAAPEHPCGRCGEGEAAGATRLCAACDAAADAADYKRQMREWRNDSGV